MPGVADVQVYGDRDKIFRVDVDQAKVASLGLTIADIAQRAGDGRLRHAGRLADHRQPGHRRARHGDGQHAGGVRELILNGRTRLGDVASVTLGGDPSATSCAPTARPASASASSAQAQSNTLDISTGVRAAAAKIQQTLPEGMNILVTGDDATFINGAIHEVELALGLSVTIVLVVIYLFLRDWRATLIPASPSRSR